MIARETIENWLTHFGHHPRRLRRYLRRLKITPKSTTQDVTELAVPFESGSHRVVLELRGSKLSVMGFSELVMERREIPSSMGAALLQRNASLHGCAWALLSYEHLKLFIVASQIDLRLLNTRRLGSVLEAVLQELEYCRENLARIQ